jgi:hypothetical protein
MGKKKTGKKREALKALQQGERVHASVLAYYARKQALNDFAMAVIVLETSKPEGLIDWDEVERAAELIACDACPGPDASEVDDEDELKDPGEVIVRGVADYRILAGLSNRFGGRGALYWAAEKTLDGVKRGLDAELLPE